jgi:hypothetical protein
MRLVAVLAGVALTVACSAREPADQRAPASPSVTRTAPPSVTRTVPPATATPGPVEFDSRAATGTVAVLADQIGPREATSPAYRRAADFVESRLRTYGYAVRREPLRVPSGVSWGVPVPAGTTYNLIATLPGFDRMKRHVLVGAHLDTVPQAPGAEDNASGIAVLLELARMSAARPPSVPVVFVAFGAEEPRGSGDARHHYGSRAYVAGLTGPERRAVAGMVSLDRVGVGSRVRVCTGGRGPRTVARDLLAAAQRLRVPTVSCANRASDHWSFEKAGVAAARIGGAPYAQYHSPRDRARVVRPAQLTRTGRVAWEWLTARR